MLVMTIFNKRAFLMFWDRNTIKKKNPIIKSLKEKNKIKKYLKRSNCLGTQQNRVDGIYNKNSQTTKEPKMLSDEVGKSGLRLWRRQKESTNLSKKVLDKLIGKKRIPRLGMSWWQLPCSFLINRRTIVCKEEISIEITWWKAINLCRRWSPSYMQGEL